MNGSSHRRYCSEKRIALLLGMCFYNATEQPLGVMLLRGDTTASSNNHDLD